jgi:hypothetical protein
MTFTTNYAVKVLSRAGRWELKNRIKPIYSWDRITVIDTNDTDRGRIAMRKCKRASICMTGRYKNMEWLWKEW